MIKTHGNFVGRLTTKTTVLLPLLSTGFHLMEILEGNTMENSGKQNPKKGFKSPPSSFEFTRRV
jgi:hypothetical protein